MLRAKEEEVVNAATHFLAAVITALITFLIIITTQHVSAALPFCIMGLTATWTFFSSFLYHSSDREPRRRRNKLVDQAAIYIMIAGNGTGIALIGSRSVATVVCSATLLLICALLIVNLCLNTKIPKIPNVITYVLFGWLAIFPSTGLLMSTEFTAGPQFFCLLGGGLAYSIGVIFCIRDHVKWYHTIWHLLVILGFGLHMLACYLVLRIT